MMGTYFQRTPVQFNRKPGNPHGEAVMRRQLRLFAIVAIALVIGEAGLAITVGRGPMLPARPWLGPTAESFAGMAAVGIAYLCINRYRMLGEPASFWIALAFAASAALVVAYVVNFPGIISVTVQPESYQAVQSWSYHLRWTTLGVLLSVAAVAGRPAFGKSSARMVGLLFLVFVAALVTGLAAEASAKQLPELFTGDRFSAFNVYWKIALSVLFVTGMGLSLRRLLQQDMPPIGYAVIVQLVAAFITGSDAFGGQRWDLFWYINRALLVGSYTYMLFALLGEYVGLYRRQGELARLAERRAAELGATFESMADGVYVLDQRPYIIDANRRALELMGFRRKEDAWRPYGEYMANRRAMHLDGTLLRPEEYTGLRALAGETVQGHVERVRLADGREALIELSGGPIRDVLGEIVGAVVVLRDVTEVQRARSMQAVARVARALTRELELAPLLEVAFGAVGDALGADAVAIYRVDESRRRLDLLGQRNLPDALVTAMQQVSLEDRATAALALATGEIQVVEDVAALPTGHALAEALRELGGPWSKLAVPLFVRGQAIGVLDCMSHRRRNYIAEELEAVTLIAELLASGLQNAFLYREAQGERQRLRTIIDNSPEGIVLFEAPRGEAVLANAAAEQMLGRPMEYDLRIEEQPRFYNLLRPNGTLCPVDELPLTRALRGEVIVNQELLIRQPGGREVATMQNAAPIRHNGGQVTGVVLLFHDISRLKQLERQREEYISIVTHDLRAPITMIIGHVGVLRRLMMEGTSREPPVQGESSVQTKPPIQSEPAVQPEPPVWEGMGESIDAIWVSAKRLDTMINDLLDMSRIDARRLPLTRETFSPLDLVQELVRRMNEMLKEHHMRLELDEEAPQVYADPVRIEQVLTNLLLNAAKFAPEGTEIVVRVSRRGSEVVVEVTDHGPGIPPEQLPRLFQRFYRSPGGRHAEGLGLGLYIAKGLVEAHGGRIWAESPAKGTDGEPRKGSTFGFALPS